MMHKCTISYDGFRGWFLIECFQCADDTGMFYGIKFFNDILLQSGPEGNVQSELILQKDMNTFTFKQGWAFPRKIYFNGDECSMPLPEDYPYLPNSAHAKAIASSALAALLLLVLLAFWWSNFIRDKCLATLNQQGDVYYNLVQIRNIYIYSQTYNVKNINFNECANCWAIKMLIEFWSVQYKLINWVPTCFLE